MTDADSPAQACRAAMRDAGAADAVLSAPGCRPENAAIHVVHGWISLCRAMGSVADLGSLSDILRAAPIPDLEAAQRDTLADDVGACAAVVRAQDAGDPTPRLTRGQVATTAQLLYTSAALVSRSPA